jgi:hypothetical protein
MFPLIYIVHSMHANLIYKGMMNSDFLYMNFSYSSKRSKKWKILILLIIHIAKNVFNRNRNLSNFILESTYAKIALISILGVYIIKIITSWTLAIKFILLVLSLNSAKQQSYLNNYNYRFRIIINKTLITTLNHKCNLNNTNKFIHKCLSI